jgi:hypothetical protein
MASEHWTTHHQLRVYPWTAVPHCLLERFNIEKPEEAANTNQGWHRHRILWKWATEESWLLLLVENRWFIDIHIAISNWPLAHVWNESLHSSSQAIIEFKKGWDNHRYFLLCIARWKISVYLALGSEASSLEMFKWKKSKLMQLESGQNHDF